MIAHAAAPEPSSGGLPSMITTFRVGGEWFGVDVLRVQEVMVPLPCTPVPRAPAQVLGLINVRGSILTCISARRRLGFSEDDASTSASMNIIFAGLESPVSLAVDEIGDVISTEGVPAGQLPAGTSAQAREQMLGVLRLNDRLIAVLAVDRLCSV